MTLYNKLFMSLMVPAMAVALTSCFDKNDDKYCPQEYSGTGVYFPSNSPTTYNVEKNSSSIQVPVYRGNTDGDLTVDVTVESLAEDIAFPPYKFAETVSFKDGEKIAYLPVTYDIEALEYDDPMKFELMIDPEYTTPYGLSSTILTLQYPSPWTVLGECTYTDEMWTTTALGIGLEISQNDLVPTRFRVPNPYYDAEEVEEYGLEPYFIFELLEQGGVFEYNDFGDILNIPVNEPDLVGYQPFYLFSDETDDGIADFYYQMPQVYGYPGTYNHVVGYQDKESQGVTLPGEIRLSPLLMDNVYGYWYGDTSADELISIVFPGYDPKDTDLEVEYVGILNSNEVLFAVADVTLGADLTSVKAGVAEGTDVSSIVDGIENGEINSVQVETSGEVKIPFSSDFITGKYSVVVLGYIGDELRSTASVSFDYYASNYNPNEGWKSLGYVEYTDGFVCTGFDTGITTYEVEIQEREDVEGYYRLVNPYGPNSPFTDIDNALGGYFYLEIDATVPDQVYIPMPFQPQSLVTGSGQLFCSSMAGMILEAGFERDKVDQVAQAQDWGIPQGGTVWGALEDGKITFPASTLALMWDDMNGSFYIANYVGTYNKAGKWVKLEVDGKVVAPFCVDFTTLKSEPSAAAKATRSSSVTLNKVQGAKKVENNIPRLSSKNKRAQGPRKMLTK